MKEDEQFKRKEDIRLFDNFDWAALGIAACGVVLFIHLIINYRGMQKNMSKCNMCNHECHCKNKKKGKDNDKCENKDCHCISCYCGGGDGQED